MNPIRQMGERVIGTNCSPGTNLFETKDLALSFSALSPFCFLQLQPPISRSTLPPRDLSE